MNACIFIAASQVAEKSVCTVILSPSLVILSEAKNPGISLRVNSAKNLLFPHGFTSRCFASLSMTFIVDCGCALRYALK
ncbi:MAG TPA: hypothetical protein VGX94_07375 [Terriglobia bacterium]|nr:hypothetical protein [Terriglobia bacterium]